MTKMRQRMSLIRPGGFPLRQAEDAIVIDTTNLDVREAVDLILDYCARERVYKWGDSRPVDFAACIRLEVEGLENIPSTGEQW